MSAKPAGRQDHILFHFDNKRSEEPTGLIWLPADHYLVGRPHKPRVGYEHALRLDVRPQGITSGHGDKFVLAAETAEKLEAWQDVPHCRRCQSADPLSHLRLKHLAKPRGGVNRLRA